ncbi:MAG: ImmA/IrrE family metallo-endopeptidase [Chloroflexi bacterium]|nr:ImmA/IrrE family metallo-endopeptidase [Chloroflexota bacterium]
MRTKTVRVSVAPEMLRWAQARSGLRASELQKAFPKLTAWEQGTLQPTLKQLEKFARKTKTPIGYFFLETPPEERLPIPDFRTMPGVVGRRPSPDLLEVIYLCQQRQEWYRDYIQGMRERPLDFVGSVELNDAVVQVAATIRTRVEFNIEQRRRMASWEEARRRFIESVEATGVLVMVSGVVGSNTHRKLDPEEFRGFALVDEWAPLIFINAADSKAAQMFTLAHELAHVWLGQSGVSDVQITKRPGEPQVERWCNQVAAEMLVPMSVLQNLHRRNRPLDEEMKRLAREFKVSTLVILRRLHDAGAIDGEVFRRTFASELERLKGFKKAAEPGGGDFYRTLKTRVGRPFAEAVIVSALEGRTLFRDAYQMLGIRNPKTFERLTHELGVF